MQAGALPCEVSITVPASPPPGSPGAAMARVGRTPGMATSVMPTRLPKELFGW